MARQSRDAAGLVVGPARAARLVDRDLERAAGGDEVERGGDQLGGEVLRHEPDTGTPNICSSSALLPDRDVLAALTRERLAVPAAPALMQRHPGQPRHQVELGGPDVAKRHRQAAGPVAPPPVTVRDPALAGAVA